MVNNDENPGLGWHPIYEMENNPNVWNHQPVIYVVVCWKSTQMGGHNWEQKSCREAELHGAHVQ